MCSLHVCQRPYIDHTDNIMYITLVYCVCVCVGVCEYERGPSSNFIVPAWTREEIRP